MNRDVNLEIYSIYAMTLSSIFETFVVTDTLMFIPTKHTIELGTSTRGSLLVLCSSADVHFVVQTRGEVLNSIFYPVGINTRVVLSSSPEFFIPFTCFVKDRFRNLILGKIEVYFG